MCSLILFRTCFRASSSRAANACSLQPPATPPCGFTSILREYSMGSFGCPCWFWQPASRMKHAEASGACRLQELCRQDHLRVRRRHHRDRRPDPMQIAIGYVQNLIDNGQVISNYSMLQSQVRNLPASEAQRLIQRYYDRRNPPPS